MRRTRHNEQSPDEQWAAEITRRAERARSGGSAGRAADEVLNAIEAKLRKMRKR